MICTKLIFSRFVCKTVKPIADEIISPIKTALSKSLLNTRKRNADNREQEHVKGTPIHEIVKEKALKRVKQAYTNIKGTEKHEILKEKKRSKVTL